MSQTGSIISEYVAVLDAHELRQLVADKNAIIAARISDAIGVKKLFASQWETIDATDDPDIQRQAFFAGVVAGAKDFRDNQGQDFTDQIVDAFVHDSIIAKISVVDEDPNVGGVFVAIIPASDTLNGLVISSGGIQTPAFADGLGITLLTREDTFSTFGDALNTITKIVETKESVEDGTNWHVGHSVSVSFYRINAIDEDVVFLHQYLVRDVANEGDFKQSAKSYSDGHVSSWSEFIDEWKSLNYPGTDIDGFVYLSQQRFATYIHEIEASAPKLRRVFGITGSEDEETRNFASDDTAPQEGTFVPILFEGVGPTLNNSLETTEPVEEKVYSAFEIEPVPSFGHGQEWVDDIDWEPGDEDTESAPRAIDSPDVVKSIQYARDIGYGDDLASAAELVVMHPHDDAPFDENSDYTRNDATAETSEPFELGAEYILGEAQAEAYGNTPEPIPATRRESYETPLEENSLSWDQLDTSVGDSGGTQEEITLDDFPFEWDETDASSTEPEPEKKSPPLRGFLTS